MMGLYMKDINTLINFGLMSSISAENLLLILTILFNNASETVI